MVNKFPLGVEVIGWWVFPNASATNRSVWAIELLLLAGTERNEK